MKVTINAGKKEWISQRKEFEEIDVIDVEDKHEAYRYVNEVVKEKIGKNKKVTDAIFVPEGNPVLDTPFQKKKLSGSHIFVYWEDVEDDAGGHIITMPDKKIIVPGKRGW